MARIAILTTFDEFNSWYSLTGIARDQATMFTKYGHDVSIIVTDKCKDPTDTPFPADVKIVKILPHGHLKDYQSGEPLTPEHEELAQKTCDALLKYIHDDKIEFVLSHDVIFQGWHKPYAIGIQKASPALPDVSWFHWIHSVPTGTKDWWHLADYGLNHKLVYPNSVDKIRVAEAYKTPTTSVRVIPHIKDLRIMFQFDELTNKVIDAIPNLMQADVVQIYPAASDRFEAKGLKYVMQIFGNIKRMGHSVCLFVANQWATTAKHKADLEEYEKFARKVGLEPGKDFVFSSSMPELPFKVGVPSKILYQLMQLSNLFIFPTNHETFGLVLPEVSLASGVLCVLNRSLHMMYEIGGGQTLYFDFGSYTNTVNNPDWDKCLADIALITMGRMQENDSILTRTWMRKRYNIDSLYYHYYAPVLAESSL